MIGEQAPPRAVASLLGLKIAGEQRGAIFSASLFGRKIVGEHGAFRVFVSELGTGVEAETDGRLPEGRDEGS